MRRRLLVVGLVLCVVLSGCSGGGLGDQSGEPSGGDGFDGGDGDGARAGDGGDAGVGDPGLAYDVGQDGGGATTPDGDATQQGRVVVKNGTISLEVENFSTAQGTLEREVTASGGFVADSSVRRHEVENVSWLTGRLVLRVPAENFTALRTAVEAQGTVREVDVGTTDVTDQLVDLNARLENLERERDRLRSFMDRANDTDDLVTIDERLSEVQGEIERLEAQRRTLLDRVAYSTLRVELAEPRPDPVDDDSDEGMAPLGQVFLNSVDDVLTAGQWLLVTTVALVPWLVAVGVPLGIAAVVVRRRRPFAWPRTPGRADVVENRGQTVDGEVAGSATTSDDQSNGDTSTAESGQSTGDGSAAESGQSTGDGSAAESGQSTGDGSAAESGQSTGDGSTADNGESATDSSTADSGESTGEDGN